MKILMALLLVLSTPAFAESSCARGYREANGQFHSRLAALEKLRLFGQSGMYMAAPGWGVCMVLKRSLKGFALCTLGALTVAGTGYLTAHEAESGQAEVRALQQMEDHYLIYQAYFSARTGDWSNDAVRKIVRALDLEPEDAPRAMAALTDLVDSGRFCDAGGKPDIAYWDAIDLIAEKL